MGNVNDLSPHSKRVEAAHKDEKDMCCIDHDFRQRQMSCGGTVLHPHAVQIGNVLHSTVLHPQRIDETYPWVQKHRKALRYGREIAQTNAMEYFSTQRHGRRGAAVRHGISSVTGRRQKIQQWHFWFNSSCRCNWLYTLLFHP